MPPSLDGIRPESAIVTPLPSHIDITCILCAERATFRVAKNNEKPLCPKHRISILQRAYRVEAEEWARDHCRITGPMELYREGDFHSPSHEEYEAGNRAAHTLNSVTALNRHRATNYDDLCRLLDKSSERDQIFHRAIRSQIDALVDDAMGPK